MTPTFRYKRLGYVALNVTDLTRSCEFYTGIVGLAPAGDGNHGEKLFRCTSRHHDVVLHESENAGLRRVGWEMESAKDVSLAREQAVNKGWTIAEVDKNECDQLGIEDAFRMKEPITGVTFEYYHNMQNHGSEFEPTVTKIERLGHIVVGTDEYDVSEAHFKNELNFRTSDRMNPAVYWMRCFPNPLHHSFAIGRAESKSLNHVNFMVEDIDDIGQAMWRMKKNNVPIVFGPGRHPPSDSVFLYFLDPDGMTLEYSFGMEEFPEVGAREPRDLTLAPESIDYWGAIREPGFGAKGNIESLEV